VCCVQVAGSQGANQPCLEHVSRANGLEGAPLQGSSPVSKGEDNLFVRDLRDGRTLPVASGRGHVLSPDGRSVLCGESPPSGGGNLYMYRVAIPLLG